MSSGFEFYNLNCSRNYLAALLLVSFVQAYNSRLHSAVVYAFTKEANDHVQSWEETHIPCGLHQEEYPVHKSLQSNLQIPTVMTPRK